MPHHKRPPLSSGSKCLVGWAFSANTANCCSMAITNHKVSLLLLSPSHQLGRNTQSERENNSHRSPSARSAVASFWCAHNFMMKMTHSLARAAIPVAGLVREQNGITIGKHYLGATKGAQVVARARRQDTLTPTHGSLS